MVVKKLQLNIGKTEWLLFDTNDELKSKSVNYIDIEKIGSQ